MVYFKHILFCPHDLFNVIFAYVENRNAYDCLSHTQNYMQWLIYIPYV